MEHWKPRSGPTALCMSCANASFAGMRDRRRRIRCAAGVRGTQTVYQCDHFVRGQRPLPQVPGHNPRQGGETG